MSDLAEQTNAYDKLDGVQHKLRTARRLAKSDWVITSQLLEHAFQRFS